VQRLPAQGSRSTTRSFHPALQRPIALGADFVVHSTTKYLNGHSDVVGGAVIAAHPEDVEPLGFWANITGVAGAPFDSYMTLRGIRTLFPRIERQQASASTIAAFLEAHPAVAAVHYPGLAAHPDHAIARAQQSGFGAMLSFELEGGIEAVRNFVTAIQVFTLAESLGGIESLIAHPATMTHVGMGAEARRKAGINDSLLRMSVGLEAEADLVADLERSLAALHP
jgi:cystathionine gamma-synthase